MKKKKKENYKYIDNVKLKKIEVGVSVFVGIVSLILLVCSFFNKVFVPATLISFALFLFCICYYYIDDSSKKKFVYSLFIVGVILIIIEVVYTLCSIL